MGIKRFINAQQQDHAKVVQELTSGYKSSCWMWYTFPQIKGLGYSPTAKYYEIQNLEELQSFVNNEYLANNLRECCSIILNLHLTDPVRIFGPIDAKKLQSSMTLFLHTKEFHKIAQKVLNKYFGGRIDSQSEQIIQELESHKKYTFRQWIANHSHRKSK